MSNWQDIKVSKPKQDQPVWYYFDVFNKVYDGFYSLEDVSDTYGKPDGAYYSDCFYGRHGFFAMMLNIGFPVKRGKENLYLK
jgi:hypothetical protein